MLDHPLPGAAARDADDRSFEPPGCRRIRCRCSPRRAGAKRGPDGRRTLHCRYFLDSPCHRLTSPPEPFGGLSSISVYDDGAGGEPSPSLPERHPLGHGREHFSRVVVGRLDGHDGAVADGYTDRRGARFGTRNHDSRRHFPVRPRGAFDLTRPIVPESVAEPRCPDGRGIGSQGKRDGGAWPCGAACHQGLLQPLQHDGAAFVQR